MFGSTRKLAADFMLFKKGFWGEPNLVRVMLGGGPEGPVGVWDLMVGWMSWKKESAAESP